AGRRQRAGVVGGNDRGGGLGLGRQWLQEEAGESGRAYRAGDEPAARPNTEHVRERDLYTPSQLFTTIFGRRPPAGPGDLLLRSLVQPAPNSRLTRLLPRRRIFSSVSHFYIFVTTCPLPGFPGARRGSCGGRPASSSWTAC